MMDIRRSEARGGGDHGWLQTQHSFSFAHYYDPKHMGFGPLRVINEDHIAPGAGFPTHSHRDMEIITYVIEGALEHKDSLGSGSVIRPGDVQRMTAGTGISHSEFNHSQDDAVHMLQIWIMPERRRLAPSYEERHFAREDLAGRLKLVASREGRDGSVSLNQDVNLYAGKLAQGDAGSLEVGTDRLLWVQLVSGSVEINGEALRPGDGASLRDEHVLTYRALAEQSELLVFDMAPYAD
ncbi:MAG: pirin family protein [Pseudomonadota bacterium]